MTNSSFFVRGSFNFGNWWSRKGTSLPSDRLFGFRFLFPLTSDRLARIKDLRALEGYVLDRIGVENANGDTACLVEFCRYMFMACVSAFMFRSLVLSTRNGAVNRFTGDAFGVTGRLELYDEVVSMNVNVFGRGEEAFAAIFRGDGACNEPCP